MKFLLVTMEYAPFYGGVAHYYEHLFKYADGQIVVLAHNEEKSDELNVYRRPLLNKNLPCFKWLPSFKAIIEVIKKEKIDTIIVGNILPLGLPVFILAKLFRKKTAIILHGLDYGITRGNQRKERLADCLLKKADKIICANHYVAELIKENLSSKEIAKIHIINPGIEPIIPAFDEIKIKAFKEKNNLTDKTVFLFVGRLVKRKGADMVISALSEALKKQTNLFLAIIGNGPEQENLEKQIAVLKLQKNIKIFNNADEVEKDAWFRACDVFIMTARQIGHDFEGFGIVYLEAGLYGKPVIAGKAGGVTDAVIDNVTGLMVDPESVDDIAGAIIKLAEYENLRNKLGFAGRERAIKDFNWQKLSHKFINLFE
ncbi:MAG: glycosyltransferase family 4 protein [Patescibacteria group bacterium]|nr:glycosyltransferase family 4 protein [Patescibacteria group bacterium]